MTLSPQRSLPVLFFGMLCVVAWALPVHAIQPQKWTHSTEADFAAGEFDGVVVTNLGDLKLATSAEPVAEMPEGVSLIFDLAKVGDTTVVAAGPEGLLLAVRDGEVVSTLPFDSYQAFAMLPVPGTQTITVALSGNPSKLVKVVLAEDELKILDEQPLPADVRYVWDLVTRNDGQEFVLATGPEGKVLSVDAQGEVTELLDTAQANILCLAEGPAGEVYAGTDTDGLVYRLDARGNAFVVYDADEPEIGALLVARDGNVYVGTANAEQARPGRLEAPAEEENGRPEVEPAADSSESAVETAEADEAADEAETETEAEPAEAVGPPSPEQLDALRAEVRKRLLAARESGTVTGNAKRSSSAARPTRNARPAPSRNGGNKSGNAVYRIDAQGFVQEIFRESVAILKIVERNDGQLVVGTGSEGQLYRIDPAAGETAVLNDFDAQQLLALTLDEGRVLVGGANPASLRVLSDTTAESGTYTSSVLDAGQISLWGTFLLTADFPAGGQVVVETRSGNVSDPEIAAWSPWSEAQVFGPVTFQEPFQPLETKVASPPARYLQYRLILRLDGSILDSRPPETPHVAKIELAYVTPNIKPTLSSLTAAYPDFPGFDQPVSAVMGINWEAADDNGDRLLYDLEFKPAGSTGGWLPLAADLADTSYDWDTRKVPDGRYHLRVTADDRLDNPGEMALTAGRLADPVLIDNTPPGVMELEIEVDGSSATVTAVAADAYSPIRSIAFTLDDATEYTPVLPDDLIYDSTSEAWSATLPNLSPGGHTLTVRTLDARGNANYTSKIFEVE